MGLPWRVRRYLYLAAVLLLVIIAFAGRQTQALIVLGLAVGGVVTSLGAGADDEPPSRQLLGMGLYDLFVALVLAGLGMQYSSLLVLVGAVAALALLRPEWIRVLGPGAGLVGAGVGYLTIEVARVPSFIAEEVAGPAFSLFVPMAAAAVITTGLAWLFASVGARLQDLARAQDQLRRSLDHAEVPVLVVDGDAIVYANPAAIVFSGSPLVGEGLLETFGIEESRSEYTVRTELVSAGDARVVVDARARPVTFDGKPLTQVTLHAATEVGTPEGTAQPAPQRRLDLLFDRIPVALYRSSPTGEVLAANPALANMLGLSEPSELLGAVEKAHSHYRDRQGRAQWVAMFDDTDVVMDYEMELSRADGSVITVTDSARAIRDRDGDILFFEGVLVDVTRQRESEEARNRTSEILEATSDLVWLTDESDRINRINAAMRTFLQDTRDDIVDAHVAEFIVPGSDGESLRAWRRAEHGPREWRGELTLRSQSGREILTSAVAQRHRNFVSLVARDITEERRTARQLEALVASKDEFIASVSHELRTPLTAVVGLASELTAFYDDIDEPTKRDFIGLIADQSAEVASIVEDLLVAARADTDSITLIHEEVDLRKAVDSVVAALPASRRDLFDVQGEAVACGDAQRIRQIVRNLATNAIRYGELPGTITIIPVDGTVLLSVADKGPGIDAAMIERIFQPYERAHAAVTQPNSVGLGLSVSRWLAEKMGGSLGYENDTMSTFILRLPATRCD